MSAVRGAGGFLPQIDRRVGQAGAGDIEVLNRLADQEMIINEEQREALVHAAKPLMEWLRAHAHPHVDTQ